MAVCEAIPVAWERCTVSAHPALMHSDNMSWPVMPAQVRDFFQKVQLSPIDTYFMIDCINGGKVPAPVDPSKIVG